MIDRVVADVQNADQGRTKTFSNALPPSDQDSSKRRSEETTENWYDSDEQKMVGWFFPGAARDTQGNAPLAPSRRSFINSIGLLAFAALPSWIADAPSTHEIIVVDGWILASTDFR